MMTLEEIEALDRVTPKGALGSVNWVAGENWQALLAAAKKCVTLTRWKADQMQVESEWDPQALAKLLGATLGQSCRKVIAERVPDLVSQLAAVTKERDEAKQREEGAWTNRNRFCQHINIIGHEVIGFTSDNCSPEAVSRETKLLVDRLKSELREAQARETALRGALDAYHDALDEGTENCSRDKLEECQAMAEAALNAPAPPVVPREDAEDLAEAFQRFYDLAVRFIPSHGSVGEEGISLKYEAEGQLATYRAKHPKKGTNS